ncbi:MAG TPA: FAD-binding protein, partial [Bradyrhizobium sp.]|nr:FAD-binding protein [Bradyrhizobium sp.]
MTIYQRHLGDPSHLPNPCVAPIEHAPFYALRIYPADLGTAVGLRTDADARVLNTNGVPIAGLYACGNDMGSIMNGNYPGPGITLGPALTFGYIAGRHLARQGGQA